MTTDLCTDDVVVCITSPQMMSTDAGAAEREASGATAGGGGAAPTPGAGGAPRVQASSAAVELGRRLLLAARAGHTALVLDLMAKGAPFTTDWLGTSPLHVAAGNAHAGTCAVLLRAGVSRDSRTKVDRTPLHLAAYGGHARVVQLLLEHGAAVDCRDLLRMTPLHWAAQRGHASAAAALLRRGADPRAVSKFNKTPRELAADEAVRALIDDALRQRAAAPSPPPAGIQEIKNRPKLQRKFTKIETKPAGGGAGGGAEGGEPAGAQLLRRHGITLLPTDDGSTVLSALQSGRTVVLSDAGKLMLKENGSRAADCAPATAVSSAAGGAAPTGGVVLTATPVSTPPKAGVKIFTINNKLVAVPRDAPRLPAKKVISPQDVQVKFVQLPGDAKMLSPKKAVQMKAKAKLAPAPRPPVKIIMNKSNYSKLIASAKTTASNAIETGAAHTATTAAPEPAAAPAGAAGAAGDERDVLRAELRAARLTIASLSAELAACRARLAHGQPAPQ